MSDAAHSACAQAYARPEVQRTLGIFAAWRLQAYGCALAILYIALLFHLYRDGVWLVDSAGKPIYTEFTCAWAAGLQALNGQAASIYDPTEFLNIQKALAGAKATYAIWPYPPTFFLFLAPFAALPYVAAFLTWNVVTVLGCIGAIYLIVPRLPAIVLLFASPFTVWNFLTGQNGYLTASLIGAGLLVLERQPVLAGVFIGCLTYKPHLGILFPVALVASRRWRAFASAAVTATLLAGASIAVFGTGVWEAFPRMLIAFARGTLLAQNSEIFLAYPALDPAQYWGRVQTVYGIIRYLDGGRLLAWVAQGITTLGLVATVWFVWRSRVRYPLQAATLSAAALIATPYAFAYDLAAIAIPLALLASDQIRFGLLKGEQTTLLVLFAASLAVFLTLGRIPFGPLIVLTLLGLVLRRALLPCDDPSPDRGGAIVAHMTSTQRV